MPTVSLDLTRCTRLFHALSDETRLAVVQLLVERKADMTAKNE